MLICFKLFSDAHLFIDACFFDIFSITKLMLSVGDSHRNVFKGTIGVMRSMVMFSIGVAQKIVKANLYNCIRVNFVGRGSKLIVLLYIIIK